jgi:hypothetical protein
MLFASGLITGEALIGIFMAVPIVVSGDSDVLAMDFTLPTMLGLAVVGALAVSLYRVARPAA